MHGLALPFLRFGVCLLFLNTGRLRRLFDVLWKVFLWWPGLHAVPFNGGVLVSDDHVVTLNSTGLVRTRYHAFTQSLYTP